MRASLLTTIILLLLLLLIRSSLVTAEEEKCEKPPRNPNYTKPAPSENRSRFRMECIENYVRKAGTSNLFKCVNKSWVNEPNLTCIRDPKLPPETTTVPKSTTQTHPPDSTTVLSYSSTSVEAPYVTAVPEISTPATSTATTRTSEQTTLRTTTVESTTRANLTIFLSTTTTTTTTSSTSTTTTTTTSSSSTSTTTTSSTSSNALAATTRRTKQATLRSITKKEMSISSISTNMLPSTFSGPLLLFPQTSTTTTLGKERTAIFSEKQGIAVGIVLLLISAAAVTAAFLLWRRRSRRQIEVLYIAEMVHQNPFSDQSLLEPLKGTSSSVPDAVQSLNAPTAGHAE